MGRCSHDSHGEETTGYFHMWLWPLSLEVDICGYGISMNFMAWKLLHLHFESISISLSPYRFLDRMEHLRIVWLSFKGDHGSPGGIFSGGPSNRTFFKIYFPLSTVKQVWLLLDWMAILGDNGFSSCQLLTTMHSTLDEPHRKEFLQAMSCAGSGWKQVVLRGFRQGLSVGATW